MKLDIDSARFNDDPNSGLRAELDTENRTLRFTINGRDCHFSLEQLLAVATNAHDVVQRVQPFDAIHVSQALNTILSYDRWNGLQLVGVYRVERDAYAIAVHTDGGKDIAVTNWQDYYDLINTLRNEAQR